MVLKLSGMTASELFGWCAARMGEGYPEGMLPFPGDAPRVGRGFFPGVSGSFHDPLPAVILRRKVMFVGQDWGCEADIPPLDLDPDADVNHGTGLRLRRLIQEAGLRLEECFFTNALFGLRKGDRNTGPAPGWKDTAYVLRCKEALEIQIREIRPEVIICLGREAPALLAMLLPECDKWHTAGKFSAIDKAGNSLLRLGSRPLGIRMAAILVHPSYRHVNVKWRSYGPHQGHAAELEILKTVRDAVAGTR